MIISLSYNKLKRLWFLGQILCSRNFRILLFCLLSSLHDSFLFFDKLIVRVNKATNRWSPDLWLRICCSRVSFLVFVIFFIVFFNFFWRSLYYWLGNINSFFFWNLFNRLSTYACWWISFQFWLSLIVVVSNLIIDWCWTSFILQCRIRLIYALSLVLDHLIASSECSKTSLGCL